MYRTIDARFWSDPKIRKLSAQAKLLFVYLITNSHTHVSGIYHLSSATMAYESGLKNPSLDTLCDTLSSAGLVRFDDENEVVWVKNMMRYQGKGEKNERSAAFHLNDLHNSLLIKDFLETYPQVLAYAKIPYRSGIQAKDADATPEQEQEQEQETPPTPSKVVARKDYSEEFESFWRTFPSLRKESKGDAFKAWQKAIKKTSAEVLISAAVEYAASPVGQGQYVKMPSTWLNKECWNDERAAWQRSDSTNGPGSNVRQLSRVGSQDDSAAAIRAKTIRAVSTDIGGNADSKGDAGNC